jgi:alpha-tubulin suppressor-like RCC1 family protein
VWPAICKAASPRSSRHAAFAALKSDGSVVTWGGPIYGGDSSSVADHLQSGVSQIFSTRYAFAALKSDGSVVTWGHWDFGGDSSSVADQLQSGVSQIFSTSAFAALKSDGSVVTWGYSGSWRRQQQRGRRNCKAASPRSSRTALPSLR